MGPCVFCGDKSVFWGAKLRSGETRWCSGERRAAQIFIITILPALPGVVQLLSFFPEKKMQHFRSITGAVEGVMLPPRVVRIDDEGRVAPAR